MNIYQEDNAGCLGCLGWAVYITLLLFFLKGLLIFLFG